MNDWYKYQGAVYGIIGAAMEVHNVLGYGLLEPIYQEALSKELNGRGIANEREKRVDIYYKGERLDKRYEMDMVVGDIVVELKSVSQLVSKHRAQPCNYLRLTHKPLGLLINFGEKDLVGEHWAYDQDTNRCMLVDRYMEPVPREENDDLLYLE